MTIVGLELWLFTEIAVLAALVAVIAAVAPRLVGGPGAFILVVVALLGYAVGRQVGLPLLLVVMLAAVALRKHRGHFVARPAWREALLHPALCLAAYVAYVLARALSEPGYATAHANARDVIAFERSLGIFVERDIQALAMRSDALLHVLNTTYGHLFFPVIITALLWLYVVDPRNFVVLRNGLAISAVLAVILFALFPVAPPRLVPEARIVDVAEMLGRPHVFTNEYAAIPSLHVGWMALTGFVVGRAALVLVARALAFIPAMVMALTVVATGNHYIVDIVVGVVLSVGSAGVVYMAGRVPAGPPAPVPGTEPGV